MGKLPAGKWASTLIIGHLLGTHAQHEHESLLFVKSLRTLVELSLDLYNVIGERSRRFSSENYCESTQLPVPKKKSGEFDRQ